jgi:RNA polymerase sigma-70 factor, ECF subfamily
MADDEDAQTLLARGDLRGAVEALLETEGDAVYGFCFHILRDATAAQDMFQQVFLEVHRDIGTYRGGSTLKTWLLSIARHRCTDLTKSDRRRRQRIEANDEAMVEFPDPSCEPHDRLDHTRLAEALQDCLMGLSEDARAAVLLRYQLDMSYEEMAEALDIKADTLCTRVSRAMPALKKCLERKGWDDE